MRSNRVVSLFFFCMVTCLASAQDVHQNQKIEYDNRNSVLFEDVGRKEQGNAIHFGNFIRLHITCDGTAYDADLTDPQIPSNREGFASVNPHVKEIRYRDQYEIWIISRVGHIADSATLYDVKGRKILIQYLGNNFAISPSGRNIAFFRRIKDGFQDAVFIDSAMVFPVIGQTDPKSWDDHKWDPNTEEPKTTNGKSLSEAVRKEDIAYEEIEKPGTWIDDTHINFTMLKIPRGNIASKSEAALKMEDTKLYFLNQAKVQGFLEEITIGGIEAQDDYLVRVDRVKVQKTEHTEEIKTNNLRF